MSERPQLTDCTVAPDLYSLVEAGHLRQQACHLDDTIHRACDHAFARDLGRYSYDCKHFLHRAVHAATRLRFDLIHSACQDTFRFAFDDSDGIEACDAVVVSEQPGAELRVVFPSRRCGDHTVVESERVQNTRDCGRCRAGDSLCTTR